MPYITIEDFKYGLDRRRKRSVGVPGTLWTGQNVHLSRGGDIERAKKFVGKYTLPANTFGLAALKEQLYVFGSISTPSMPNGVRYQRLQLSSDAMVKVLDARAADGKLFVIAEYDSGNLAGFYDGARITGLDDLADANSDLETTAGYMADKLNGDGAVEAVAAEKVITITAKVAGTAFTLTKATAELTTSDATGSVEVTAGTNNPGTNIIDQVTINGATTLLSSAIDWTTSNDATAILLRNGINAGTGTHGVTATAAGAVVTLTRANARGWTVAATTGGDVTTTDTAFSGGTVNDQDITLTEVQANVAAVSEVQATGTVEITGGSAAPTNNLSALTVNGTALIAGTIVWSSSNEATATALVNAIMSLSGTHGYTAAAVGAVVTITAAPGTGTTPNGYVVAATTEGDFTVSTANMSGGVAAVTAVAQVYTAEFVGSYDATDQFTLTLNGTAYKVTGRASGYITSAYVQKRRIYATANSLERYSELNDFDDWTTTSPTATGAGFINISNETEGTDRLVGAVTYNGFAAIFARQKIQIISLDTDPDNNAVGDSVDNFGTMARHSLLNYGNNDVFFLHESGIRSLRARSGVNAPYVNDIGTAIDTYVAEKIAGLTEAELADAKAVVEPIDGRFLLALGESIFVLSYFPGSKINAWSEYVPGFAVSDWAVIKRKLFARSGNTIYLYGGDSGSVYPDANEQIATVELPFITAEDPAARKLLTGMDFALTGEWTISVLTDPNDETKIAHTAVARKVTYAEGEAPSLGYSSMIAFKLVCAAAGEASLSMLSLHYEKGETR